MMNAAYLESKKTLFFGSFGCDIIRVKRKEAA
jgi:hypothetical protein